MRAIEAAQPFKAVFFHRKLNIFVIYNKKFKIKVRYYTDVLSASGETNTCLEKYCGILE